MILGATGSISSLVVRLLLGKGVPVTAAVRDLDKAKAALPSQAAVVRADFTDAASVQQAAEASKAQKVFLYPAAVSKELLAAFKAARCVRHLVMVSTSFIGLGLPADNMFTVYSSAAEAAVRDAGFAYTFLRCESFATNTLWWKYAIARGEVQEAYVDGPVPLVAVEDIAAVAVQALSSSQLDNTAVNIVGPEALSVRQQVAVISAVLGKPITVSEQSEEEFVASRKEHQPAAILNASLQYKKFRQEQGGQAQSSPDKTVVGSTTFKQFVEMHKGEFALGPH